MQRTSLDFSLTLNKSHVLQNRTRQMRKNIQIPTKPKKKLVVTIFTWRHEVGRLTTYMYNSLTSLVLLKLQAHQYKWSNLSSYNFVTLSSDRVIHQQWSLVRPRLNAGAQYSKLVSNKRWAMHLSLTLHTDFLCQLGSSCPHGLCPQFHGEPIHKFHGYEQTSRIPAEKNTKFTS